MQRERGRNLVMLKVSFLILHLSFFLTFVALSSPSYSSLKESEQWSVWKNVEEDMWRDNGDIWIQQKILQLLEDLSTPVKQVLRLLFGTFQAERLKKIVFFAWILSLHWISSQKLSSFQLFNLHGQILVIHHPKQVTAICPCFITQDQKFHSLIFFRQISSLFFPRQKKRKKLKQRRWEKRTSIFWWKKEIEMQYEKTSQKSQRKIRFFCRENKIFSEMTRFHLIQGSICRLADFMLGLLKLESGHFVCWKHCE